MKPIYKTKSLSYDVERLVYDFGGDYKAQIYQFKNQFNMSKKLEITDLLGNDANRVLPAVDIDSIWKERNNFCRNVGRQPNYVMIHICNKRSILEEAQKANIYELMCPTNNHRCFGMKIIWTTDIGENDVICTYNGK